MSNPIRVIVAGANGRMGREVLATIRDTPDIKLVGAFDRNHVGEPVANLVPGLDGIVSGNLEELIQRLNPDVLVELTHHSCAADHARLAISNKVATIIGTSGLSAEEIQSLREFCDVHRVPCGLIPNFSIGGVLMMHFAKIAAEWMPHAEVIELHHDGKLDAPSGTATRTAELIAESRKNSPQEAQGAVEKIPSARGAQHHQVRVHSVRLPGFVASQETLFGGKGQRLSIRHDSIDRASFMDGVLLSIRQIRGQKSFFVGLDKLMGLS
ncbi:4-hydroxy-tetrahydrodipicolinate reductase [Kamptonema cortianum]|nr:4-hydroxy-tetrahydrodipicolinate reductase [Geitlerinema splendidum]MDK3160335.1 4-hydroxy-tetrahydrodipicolinate reductase [Kamptonema cortianum]